MPKLATIVTDTRQQLTTTVNRVKSLSAGAVLVRMVSVGAVVVLLTAALPLGMILSAPPSVPLRVGLAVLAIALGVGVFPASRWPTLVAFGSIVLWVISSVGLGEQASLVRVAILSAALYVMHTATALAAVLPYDCVVAPGVLLRWLTRTSAVLGSALALGIGGMALVGQLPSVPTMIATVVGSLVAAGLVGLLAWHLLRRRA